MPRRPPPSSRRPAREEPSSPPPPRPGRQAPRPASSPHASEPVYLARNVRVVYEDADLIVIDKPVGLITADPNDRGGGDTGSISCRKVTKSTTLFDLVKAHVRESRRGGASRNSLARARRKDGGDPASAHQHADAPKAYVIHRLDKDASGLLVFAKNQHAFNWLKEDFKAKRTHRLYIALAEGVGPRLGQIGATGTVQAPIPDDPPGSPRPASQTGARAARGKHGRGPEHDEDGSKPAVTHFRVIGTSSPVPSERGLTLLEVRLETGRKNQIRVHLSGLGHPLSGDQRFGARGNALGRLGLHAAELGFHHPSTGEQVRFTSVANAGFYRAVGLRKPESSETEGGSSHRDPEATGPTIKPAAGRADTSWEPVAEWYDKLLEPDAPGGAGRETASGGSAPRGGDGSAETSGNDHYAQTVLPGALRLIEPAKGLRVLDLACGQGILSRRLSTLGCEVVGVDAAPGLIEAARRRSAEAPAKGAGDVTFHVGDACELTKLNLPEHWFDRVACVMALSNIEPLEPVLGAVARLLKPGGMFVAIITHPAFRAIGQSHWGWDEKTRTQYRRIDGYLSAAQKRVAMHPGKAARNQSGGEATTWTFHRPLQTYVSACAKAGLLIDRMEEWPSMRASDSGPRAPEENRARREIPLFLGLRGVLVPRAVKG